MNDLLGDLHTPYGVVLALRAAMLRSGFVAVEDVTAERISDWLEEYYWMRVNRDEPPTPFSGPV